MRIVITEFISLDGVVQAPGGPNEDTDGGFAHGGWSHPFFDGDAVGGGLRRRVEQRRRTALRAAHMAVDGRGVARARRRPLRRSDECDPQARGVRDARRRRADVEQHDPHPRRSGGSPAIRELRETRGRRPGGDGERHARANAASARGWSKRARLMIEPVILGGGKTIFPGDGASRTFELVSTVTSGTGVHVAIYRPVAAA